jgi:hypothetical protein
MKMDGDSPFDGCATRQHYGLLMEDAIRLCQKLLKNQIHRGALEQKSLFILYDITLPTLQPEF